MEPGWELTKNAFRPAERGLVKFSVGLVRPHRHGPGDLLITRGTLAARPSGRLGRRFFGVDEIDHQPRLVHVNLSLLLPPWMNVRMIVFGRDEHIGVVLSWWNLASVQRALTDQGFDVRVSRSLLPAGWSDLADGNR